MVESHVELYEALKESVGPKAARMMTDLLPPAGNLATKDDLAQWRTEIQTDLRAQVNALETRMLRWALGFFVPLWLGVWGAVVAVILNMLRG